MHALQAARIAADRPCRVIGWHYVDQKGQLTATPTSRLRVTKHQVSNMDVHWQQDLDRMMHDMQSPMQCLGLPRPIPQKPKKRTLTDFWVPSAKAPVQSIPAGSRFCPQCAAEHVCGADTSSEYVPSSDTAASSNADLLCAERCDTADSSNSSSDDSSDTSSDDSSDSSSDSSSTSSSNSSSDDSSDQSSDSDPNYGSECSCTTESDKGYVGVT
jgi:hypothetical protein|uniref:Uncharacterized protein n=1 Tax=Eutreptiella gymnastica TaxID=73025 RepID=A0A7S4LII0_9EUGL|mmetsp:Transcript_49943/g.82302  ORF Transcript_49943/g.82302 Transcript_49943/m.82302 type:complete len:214 (-) Transcript_49943:168-809(-)